MVYSLQYLVAAPLVNTAHSGKLITIYTCRGTDWTVVCVISEQKESGIE